MNTDSAEIKISKKMASGGKARSGVRAVPRRYSAEEKRTAVAAVATGSSRSEVARRLGCSVWSIGHWMKESRMSLKKGAVARRGQKSSQALAKAPAGFREMRIVTSKIRAPEIECASGVITMVTPSGYRVSGLSGADLVNLLRQLG